jgi:DNA-binding CsgD family transcriptional regulator
VSTAVRCPEVAGASTPTDLVESWVMNVVRHSLVVFELASGNYKSAFTLASASSLDDDLASEVSVADVVEAAVRSGHHAYAAATLAACSERLGEPTTPLSIGLVHRSHALVADDSRAEALYLQAIDALERATFPGQLARTRLLYGEWLRRRGRRVASREQLRAAIKTFTALGAETFTARAQAELAATSEHTRERASAPHDALTAQEARIADLASGGATNAEIAAQLFISPHTVDYHLRKVYRKLHLSSRRSLATRLAVTADAA